MKVTSCLCVTSLVPFKSSVLRLAPASKATLTSRTLPCFPPSCALPGTFAPRPGLIHLATPLRPEELKALFVCTPWEILTPRLRSPTKQRKHLLTAKALTNSAFQMNPAPCGAEGGERPGEKSPKHLLVFADYRKPGGAVLWSHLSWLATVLSSGDCQWRVKGKVHMHKYIHRHTDAHTQHRYLYQENHNVFWFIGLTLTLTYLDKQL